MVGIGWISSLVGVGVVSSAYLPSPNDLLRSTSAVLPNWVGQSQYRAMTGRYLAATSSGDDRDGLVLACFGPHLCSKLHRGRAVEANGEMEWGRDFGMQSKNCVERPFDSAHDTPRWRARERCQLQRAQRGIGADHDTSLLATTAALPPPRPGGRAGGRRHIVMTITPRSR